MPTKKVARKDAKKTRRRTKEAIRKSTDGHRVTAARIGTVKEPTGMPIIDARRPPAKKTSKKATTRKAPIKAAAAMVIPTMDLRMAELYFIGTTELVVHKWSEKSLIAMADKDEQKAKQAAGKRRPEQEFEDAKYVLEDGRDGFPANAFRLAMIDAGTSCPGITKTAIRQALHVLDDYVVIHGTPRQRRDTVRLSGAGNKASLRYRPGYSSWWCMLRVEYNAGMLSEEQLVNLANLAGFAVGIGEHRPQKNGSWGRFRVATEADMARLKKSQPRKRRHA